MTHSIMRSSLDAVDLIRDLGRADQLTPERLKSIQATLGYNLHILWQLTQDAPASALNAKAARLIETSEKLLDLLVAGFASPGFTAAKFEDWTAIIAEAVAALATWLDTGTGPLTTQERSSAVIVGRFHERAGVMLTVFDGGRA